MSQLRSYHYYHTIFVTKYDAPMEAVDSACSRIPHNMFASFTGTTMALVSTMVFHAIKEYQTGSQVMAKSEGQESVDNEYHSSHPIVSL